MKGVRLDYSFRFKLKVEIQFGRSIMRDILLHWIIHRCIEESRANKRNISVQGGTWEGTETGEDTLKGLKRLSIVCPLHLSDLLIIK